MVGGLGASILRLALHLAEVVLLTVVVVVDPVKVPGSMRRHPTDGAPELAKACEATQDPEPTSASSVSGAATPSPLIGPGFNFTSCEQGLAMKDLKLRIRCRSHQLQVMQRLA